MANNSAGTFWTNLGVFPVEINAINAKGPGAILFKSGDADVLSSGNIAGGPSEYHDHLLYAHTFTAGQLAALTAGQTYTLVFRDSDGAEKTLYSSTGLRYVSEKTAVDFSESEHANIRWYDAAAGGTTIAAQVYFGNNNGPKNVTEADLEAAATAISLSTGSDTFAVTGYQNGAWLDGGYSYEMELVLNKALVAGNYTAYAGEAEIRTFTIEETEQDAKPRVYGSDLQGGYVQGVNLPMDGVYTGKLYRGYTCLTDTAFPMTLQGENNGNTQYLYFPKAILAGLDAGGYEIRVYLGSKILGSAELEIRAATQPIVTINDDDGDWNDSGDPVIHSQNVRIEGNNMGAYGYLRWAETEEALAQKAFTPYFSNQAYIHTFAGEDGPRRLYVQLSKTGHVEAADNLLYSFELWLCTDGDYDVQVPEEIQGVQNPADGAYAITATAELPATNLWVAFYDASGKYASRQMTYAGETGGGRHAFSLAFNVGEHDCFYDYYSYGGEFYYKDTQSIRVFAVDLSNTYHSNEAYRGNLMGEPVERILVFGDPEYIILPQFAAGEVLTNETSFPVYGYATPNSMVTVEANDPAESANNTSTTAWANGYGFFTATLSGLSQARYALNIYDSTGIHIKNFTVYLTVDATAPTIGDVGFTFLAGGSAVVRWTCEDTDVDHFEVYKNGVLLGSAAATARSYNVVASADDGSTFTIKAFDKAGNTGQKTVSTADTEAPTAPGTPSVTGKTTTSVTLSWTAGTDNMGIAGYNIYQDGTKVAETAGESVLTYTVAGLTQGTAYSFTVKTRDQAGNLSPDSTPLSASTVGLTLSSADLKSGYIADEFSNKKIPVAFTVTADAEGYEVGLSGARIEYRATGASGEWSTGDMTVSGSGAAGNWDISGSEDGYLPMGSYDVRFGAEDSLGANVSSDPVNVVLLKRDDVAPTVPGTPTADSHSTVSITFYWEASTDNVGVDHYEVYRGDSKVGDPASASYTDTGLAMGTAYSYTVKAVDARGNTSAASTPATLSTMTLEFHSTIDFEASYTMEEQAAKKIAVWAKFNPETGYDPDVTMAMEYKASAQEAWTSVDLTVDGSDANLFKGAWPLEGSDTGYLPEGSYTVRFAVTDGSATAYSDIQTVSLLRDAVKPQMTDLTPASGTYGGKALSLYAAATDNVGVARIVLSYSADGQDFEITTLTNTAAGSPFGGGYTWDASALASGSYTLKAIAYDLRGNASDARTSAITIDNTPPAKPDGFTVTATSRYIHVMWDSGYEAPADFSTFNVYRAESENGDYTRVGGGAAIGYFDDGETAEAGKTYYYYVTAQDKYGNESAATAKLSATLIADSESPTIGDMLPGDDAVLRKSAQLKVTAADNYRLAKAVFEYRLKGAADWTPIGEKAVAGVTNNTTFSYSWDISALAAGTYEVRVSVYDDSVNDVGAGSGYAANAPAVLIRTVAVSAYSAPVAPAAEAQGGYKTAVLSWTYGGSLDTLKRFELYRTDAAGGSADYVAAVKAGASGSYTVAIPAEGTQYFKIAAMDKYGAFAYSAVVSVASAGSDTVDPVAVILPETLCAATGVAFSFSGADSTDNDAIASYSWDFGDGGSGSGKVCAHTYTAAGTYGVRLTVLDESGNSDTAEAEITVYDVTSEDAAHALMTVSVVNGYAQDTPAVPGASVKVYDGAGFETTAVTDSNGRAMLVVPIGGCTVSAVADGYVAVGRAVEVEPEDDGTFAYTLGIAPVNVSTVDGSLTSTEMTYNEILAAGIDVTDPDNEHVWKFAAELQFVAGPALPFTLPVTAYYNQAGDFVGGSGWGWQQIGGGSGGGWGGLNIGLFPISENFVLIIYGEAHWLKEMYNVELLVINNSYVDDITDCVASLALPDGLSLASMTSGKQTETIELGTVPHKTGADNPANTAKANWYVRGDAEGEYNLTAAVTGRNPEPFVKSFTTDRPLKVYAGSALKLFITAEDIAYKGDEYHVQFKLQNVSDKELYNLSFGITGAEQFKVLRIGDHEAQLPLTEEDFGGEMTQSIDVLEPGGYIAIDFSTTTWFNSALELADLGPLDVGYYLTGVFVTTLEGSTTTIPYEINITHANHGSFFEWIWGEAKGFVQGKSISLLDSDFLGDIGLLKNGVKVYKFLTEDTTDAGSKAEITIVGGRFTPANNFLRTLGADAVTVYTDAPEDRYTISPDGGTMTITGPANIYVQGGAAGAATMTVKTHAYDLASETFVPNTYTVNYTVSNHEGTAQRVVLQAPDTDTAAIPLAGQTVKVNFPYALLDENGHYLEAASNAAWTIEGTDTAGLSLDKGVLTVASTAKGGTYTVRLALSAEVYAEQTITLTREDAVETAVKLYRGGSELGETDTLVIPVGDGTDTHTYTAKLFDQYGVEMAAEFTWQTTENTSGATPANGVIALTRSTEPGTLTLAASAAGKSASVAVTITNLAVDWSGVAAAIAGTTYTYGDANGKAALPASGTAVALETVTGTFSYANGAAVQHAGQRKITVIFTADEDAGEYAGATISREFTITVGKKALADGMISITGSYTYTGSAIAPAYAVADGALLTAADYTAEVTGNVGAGMGTVTVTAAAEGNYAGSATKTFPIAKAAITGFQTAAPTHTLLANDAANTGTAALKAIANDGAALPGTVTVTFGDGLTEVLPIVWADSGDAFAVKGGSYTYPGTVTSGDNFYAYAGKLNATVTVTPVTGTLVTAVPGAVTVAKSTAAGAAGYADFRLPTSIELSFDQGVTNQVFDSLTWDVSVSTLKNAAVGSVTPVALTSLPAWITMDVITVAVTITDKYPVSVDVTPPAGVTYGAVLGDPVPQQTAQSDGVDSGATWTYLYEGTTAKGAAYSSSAKPTQAGSYTVTATLVSQTHAGSGNSAVFTIAPKTLTGDMLSITGSYTYTGLAITPTYSVADGTLLTTSDYTAEVTDNVNAGSAATVKLTGKHNYQGVVSKTFAIAPASIAALSPTVVGNAEVGQTLSGLLDVVNFSAADFTWQWRRGDTVVGDGSRTYTLTAADSGSVITLAVIAKDATNYTGTSQTSGAVSVAKVAVFGALTITEHNGSGTDGSIDAGDVLTVSIAGITPIPAQAGGTLQWYRDGAPIDGETSESYTVTAADTDAILSVVFTPASTFTGTVSTSVEVGKLALTGTLTVTGSAQVGGVLTATFTTAAADGYDLLWSRDGMTIDGASGGSYTVVKADQGKTVTAKAVAKGLYTGEVLAASGVAIPAAAPDQPVLSASAGSGRIVLTWATPADNGASITGYELQMDGITIANPAANATSHTVTGLQNRTAYTFLLLAENAEGITASSPVTATPKTSGGGQPSDGGTVGGSDAGGSDKETVTHPDGSVTTTETDKGTGTVTQTTKYPDGAMLVIETRIDGTVSSTETQPNGVRVETTTTASGETAARVTVPQGMGSVTVTIPMARQPEPGDVAVILHADGTREVVKNSRPTEDGMPVTLHEGATLEIANRAKDFSDVADDNWAADAVAFVSARELFSGTTETTYSPNDRMTRAMLMTVLARLEGKDTDTGSTWYEEGMNWAVENGISDGTNPNGSITREQLATMLWRYAGSPAGNGSLTAFSDADQVSDYAGAALCWAVEQGIVSGRDNGALDPQSDATRAEVAAMLMRFIANVL
ncbi:MAG: PKD domain-containing protein [Clostridiales bacterium]|nr:PKD domain-containing protein [Clostridiales bacterium]